MSARSPWAGEQLASSRQEAYGSIMSATLETLFAEALELPDESRLELVERLIPTIKPEPSVEAAQLAEVVRRMEEVQSGEAQLVPGDEVFRKVRESLATRRA